MKVNKNILIILLFLFITVGVEATHASTAIGQGAPTAINHAPLTINYAESQLQDTFLTDLSAMGSQLSATMLAQAGIIGTFFDAQAHIQGQMLIQELHAEAHNKYQPSRALCRFGTNVRSLAASEKKSDLNVLMMNNEIIARETSNAIHLGANQGNTDKWAEAWNFASRHCNVHNNGTKGLFFMCDGIILNNERINKDVNYTKLIDTRPTLDIDFADNIISEDEKDVLVMSHMLYSNRLYPKAEKDELLPYSSRLVNLNHRSVMAKNAIARDSFINIVGMKSSGSATVSPYFKSVISEMGLANEADIDNLYGTNPSYHAQMEVLTKKIYQNPNFYTGLIDKPANIDRQRASMEAFASMQDRDIYESLIRREMLLSQILEIQIEKEQWTTINKQAKSIKEF